MEEGHQTIRLSYTAELKCDVVQRAGEKENRKAARVLELMKATLDCCITTRQRLANVRHHERNSLDPIKGDFLKLMMHCSHFFKRDARLQRNCIGLF
jgi:hypothetical protein